MEQFKKNLLHWARQFSTTCILDSNKWNGSEQEIIAAFGSVDKIIPSENSFEELRNFHVKKGDWLFGHLSYDLKNEIENLSSGNFDGVGFPQLHFFQPEYIFILQGDRLQVGFLPEMTTPKKIETIVGEICSDGFPSKIRYKYPLPEIKNRILKDEYVQSVNKIKQHIRRGDIYEMNYCMEFFGEGAPIDPVEVFLSLSETSKTPFSAFYRMGNSYLMCASPERFLKKTGNKIVSQPIKGTSKRGENSYEDALAAQLLSKSEKEKSENVMIVDLVRNDLSKTCNHVTVDELFGIYTFRQWHQMVSTVRGELRPDLDFMDVIKNSFPMGSMTGAPKIRAMELIEEYEKTKRGLYSGAVGYITPDGDFDLNVVIRSILYNSSSNYLSFQAGSAITANSVPEAEYEECLLKAKGMFEALKINGRAVNSSEPVSPELFHA